MRIFIVIGILLATNLACTGHLSPWASKTSKSRTQLEIREMQTREFEGVSPKEAMKTLLDVLQDDGFIVKNAVMELGLLSAAKEVDVRDSGDIFLNSLIFGEQARWNVHATIEATANVSEFGKRLKVRVNFQVKTLDNYGGVAEVHTIDDEKYYQDFFSKVDKGLFIHKENI